MSLRVLVAYDRDYARGFGESGVVALADSLAHAGHEVDIFSTTAPAPKQPAIDERLPPPLPRQEALPLLRAHVKAARPALIHMLHWHAHLSPSVYRVAREFKIPLVQSALDFQLHCLQGGYFRNDQHCEDCLGHGRFKGVARACSGGSRRTSAGLATRLAYHELIGDFSRTVTLYLAPTFYARAKLIAGGLPADRVVVRAPCIDIPLPRTSERANGLFIGPFNDESGFLTLMRAAAELADVKIDVVGNGENLGLAEQIPAFNVIAPLDDRFLEERIARNRYLIYPAPNYTGFADTIIRAFGARLPVLASATSGIDELVEDGRTGLMFEPGNSRDLLRKIRWANAHPEAMLEMGRNARITYQERFSPLRGAKQLIDAYDLARQLVNGSVLGVPGVATTR
jgi:glycosyltransferase involved in cell wall biosynthesis